MSSRNGQAIMREFNTSSRVIGSRKLARGWKPAHLRCTTPTLATFSMPTP